MIEALIAAIIGFVVFLASHRVDRTAKRKLVPAVVLRWESEAKDAAAEFGVPWEVVLATIWKESGGTWDPPGKAGEIGLGQLKEHEAIADIRMFGLGEFLHWDTQPRDNIRAIAAYYNLNLRSGRAKGDIRVAARMYNQGPTGAFTKPEKSIPYANNVLAKAKLLGFTP